MPAPKGNEELPSVLLGTWTPEVEPKVKRFSFNVAEIFESWFNRRTSPHTQRAYRQDVMSLVRFQGLAGQRRPEPLQGHRS